MINTGEWILSCFAEKKEKSLNWWWIVMVVAIWVACITLMATASYAENLTASYYSVAALVRDGQWDITKGVMANGKLFRDSGATAACNSVKLGRSVLVTNLSNGKSVVVLVTDRTAKRFTGKRIDLAISQFAKIADLKQGLVPVSVKEVI